MKLQEYLNDLQKAVIAFSKLKLDYNCQVSDQSADDDKCLLYEQKFFWSNAFDLVKLHYDLLQFRLDIEKFDRHLTEKELDEFKDSLS